METQTEVSAAEKLYPAGSAYEGIVKDQWLEPGEMGGQQKLFLFLTVLLQKKLLNRYELADGTQPLEKGLQIVARVRVDVTPSPFPNEYSERTLNTLTSYGFQDSEPETRLNLSLEHNHPFSLVTRNVYVSVKHNGRYMNWYLDENRAGKIKERPSLAALKAFTAQFGGSFPAPEEQYAEPDNGSQNGEEAPY